MCHLQPGVVHDVQSPRTKPPDKYLPEKAAVVARGYYVSLLSPVHYEQEGEDRPNAQTIVLCRWTNLSSAQTNMISLASAIGCTELIYLDDCLSCISVH